MLNVKSLSQTIIEEEYWERRLSQQWAQYRRSRTGHERQYHRAYIRKIIQNIRDWKAEYAKLAYTR